MAQKGIPNLNGGNWDQLSKAREEGGLCPTKFRFGTFLKLPQEAPKEKKREVLSGKGSTPLFPFFGRGVFFPQNGENYKGIPGGGPPLKGKGAFRVF